MSLLEYLDRTGKHVSAKTFEKYKDEKYFEYVESGHYYNILPTILDVLNVE